VAEGARQEKTKLESTSIDRLTLYYDPAEQEAAKLIGQACADSVRLIGESWGLDMPADCRVYVMTSWPQFLFHSAPWHWRILLGLSVPLWYGKVNRLWKLAGGWQQQYGRRRAVGVKPPRIRQLADTSIGKRIFIQEDDADKKVRRTTCHELTHAYTAHLRLPMWLNEGIAMVTVDRLAGQPTVQPETVHVLKAASQGAASQGYRQVLRSDADTMVYQVVRGYWLTRYIEDTRPDLLRGLLQQRQPQKVLESKVAAAYEMEMEGFWSGIDSIVASHFGEGSL
jgi:hypothetical protein